MKEQDTLYGLLLCPRHFRQWRRRQRVQRLLSLFDGSLTAAVATVAFIVALGLILALVQ